MNSEQKGHGRQHSWRNKRYYFGIILDILQEIMLTSIKTVSLSTAVSMQLALHDKTIFPCPKQMRQLQVSPVSQCPFPTCSTLRSLYIYMSSPVSTHSIHESLAPGHIEYIYIYIIFSKINFPCITAEYQKSNLDGIKPKN